MKESYEALKMEVIAFDGDIFTDDATGVVTAVETSGRNPSSYAGRD